MDCALQWLRLYAQLVLLSRWITGLAADQDCDIWIRSSGKPKDQLADRFVRTAPEITAAVDRLDRDRDPDGRFRVNELFCAEDTWGETVPVLMAQAGVVLLDLREYKASHAGTRYEIFVQLVSA